MSRGYIVCVCVCVCVWRKKWDWLCKKKKKKNVTNLITNQLQLFENIVPLGSHTLMKMLFSLLEIMVVFNWHCYLYVHHSTQMITLEIGYSFF